MITISYIAARPFNSNVCEFLHCKLYGSGDDDSESRAFVHDFRQKCSRGEITGIQEKYSEVVFVLGSRLDGVWNFQDPLILEREEAKEKLKQAKLDSEYAAGMVRRFNIPFEALEKARREQEAADEALLAAQAQFEAVAEKSAKLAPVPDATTAEAQPLATQPASSQSTAEASTSSAPTPLIEGEPSKTARATGSR